MSRNNKTSGRDGNFTSCRSESATPISSPDSPNSKKGLWATIKEVTQRMLAFGDRSEEVKAKFKNNTKSVENRVGEHEMSKPSKKINSDKNISKINTSTHDSSAKTTRDSVKKHNQLSSTNCTSTGNSNISKSSATNKTERLSKETQTIPSSKVILLIKEDINKLCAKDTTLVQSKCWEDFEKWAHNPTYHSSKKYKIVDCCGFPILYLHSVPRSLGCYLSEMLVHILSARYYEHGQDKELVEHTVESWAKLDVNCVIDLSMVIPIAFSNFFHKTKFQFTPSGVECKVAMNGELIADLLLGAPRGMGILHKLNLLDSKDQCNDVSFACKLIARILKLESQTGHLPHQELVEIFCKSAPQVCLVVGKCIVELGRQAQLLFLNMDANCFFASFDPRDSWKSEEAKLNSALINEASNTATGLAPHSIFTRKTILYLMVILKSHVATCYRGLWNRELIENNQYPRLTRLFVHTIYNLCKSGTVIPQEQKEINFNAVWNQVKDRFLEAFILDACGSIKRSEGWRAIVKEMQSGQDNGLTEEMVAKTTSLPDPKKAVTSHYCNPNHKSTDVPNTPSNMSDIAQSVMLAKNYFTELDCKKEKFKKFSKCGEPCELSQKNNQKEPTLPTKSKIQSSRSHEVTNDSFVDKEVTDKCGHEKNDMLCENGYKVSRAITKTTKTKCQLFSPCGLTSEGTSSNRIVIKSDKTKMNSKSISTKQIQSRVAATARNFQTATTSSKLFPSLNKATDPTIGTLKSESSRDKIISNANITSSNVQATKSSEPLISGSGQSTVKKLSTSNRNNMNGEVKNMPNSIDTCTSRASWPAKSNEISPLTTSGTAWGNYLATTSSTTVMQGEESEKQNRTADQAHSKKITCADLAISRIDTTPIKARIAKSNVRCNSESIKPHATTIVKLTNECSRKETINSAVSYISTNNKYPNRPASTLTATKDFRQLHCSILQTDCAQHNYMSDNNTNVQEASGKETPILEPKSYVDGTKQSSAKQKSRPMDVGALSSTNKCNIQASKSPRVNNGIKVEVPKICKPEKLNLTGVKPNTSKATKLLHISSDKRSEEHLLSAIEPPNSTKEDFLTNIIGLNNAQEPISVEVPSSSNVADVTTIQIEKSRNEKKSSLDLTQQDSQTMSSEIEPSVSTKKPRKRKKKNKNRFVVAPELLTTSTLVQQNFVEVPQQVQHAISDSCRSTQTVENDGDSAEKASTTNVDENSPCTQSNNTNKECEKASGDRELLSAHEQDTVASKTDDMSLLTHLEMAPSAVEGFKYKCTATKRRTKTSLRSAKGKSKLVMSIEGRIPPLSSTLDKKPIKPDNQTPLRSSNIEQSVPEPKQATGIVASFVVEKSVEESMKNQADDCMVISEDQAIDEQKAAARNYTDVEPKCPAPLELPKVIIPKKAMDDTKPCKTTNSTNSKNIGLPDQMKLWEKPSTKDVKAHDNYIETSNDDLQMSPASNNNTNDESLLSSSFQNVPEIEITINMHNNEETDDCKQYYQCLNNLSHAATNTNTVDFAKHFNKNAIVEVSSQKMLPNINDQQVVNTSLSNENIAKVDKEICGDTNGIVEEYLLGKELYHVVNHSGDVKHTEDSYQSPKSIVLRDGGLDESFLCMNNFSVFDSETPLDLSLNALDESMNITNRNMWTNSYLGNLSLDPLDELIAQQNMSGSEVNQEPFMVIPTTELAKYSSVNKEIAESPLSGLKHNDISADLGEYCSSKSKMCVGEYTFNLSTNMRIGPSSRDGVDVFPGMHKCNGTAVAAKYCLRQTTLDLTQILGPINKSNLVRLLDISLHNPRSLVMIMELCDCNLRTFITSDVYKENRSPMKKRMCHELLSGLNVLHANNIIHNNLKPENILIGKDGIVKIADYPVVSNWTEFMNQLPCRNSDRLCWEATEVKKRLNNYSAHRSDIQVSGMLLHYIMCDGLHPYGKLNSTVISVDSNIRAGQYSIQTEEADARNLLSWMIIPDPNARKDTNVCLTHPYFWSQKKQVQFMAAVGRQPEIRSGFRTNVLDQINFLGQWLAFSNWKDKVDLQLFISRIPREPRYDNTVGQLLKFISDIYDITNMSDDLVEAMGGDKCDYISSRFSPCVLPIYEIIIKSPLCLKPQVEDVIHMSTKSCNAF